MLFFMFTNIIFYVLWRQYLHIAFIDTKKKERMKNVTFNIDCPIGTEGCLLFGLSMDRILIVPRLLVYLKTPWASYPRF